MTNIIDGKAIAATIRGEIAQKVAELKASRGIVPGLAVIIVGEDPASKVYVRNKHRACALQSLQRSLKKMANAPCLRRVTFTARQL